MTRKIKYTHIIKKINILIMVLIMGCMVGCDKTSGSQGSSLIAGSSILPAPKKQASEAQSVDSSGNIIIKGVLSRKDTDLKKLNFVDISSGIEYEVPYTGGTSIKSKYGTQITPGYMTLGKIYDVKCDKKGNATEITGDSGEWEISELENISVDEQNRKITFDSETRSYSDKAVVLSGNDIVNISEVVKQDEVTLRGIDNTIYSITVDQPHGYIRFTGVGAFEGGYVSIGNSQVTGVTEGMLVTARAGSYDIDIQSGSLSAVKTVTVEKGKQIEVDFSEYTQPAKHQGAVNFMITPASAIMSIDGKEIDYKEPVQLTYGSHKLTLSANYYETYTETFIVNSSYVTKTIDMTAKSSSSSTKSSSTATSATSSTGSSTAASNNKVTYPDSADGYQVNITKPEGASLYVDSQYIGVIPCSFDKKTGTRTITLSKTGYNTVSYSITLDNAAGNVTYSFPDMTKSSGN